MLRIEDLHAGYGATPILFGVSLEVREGEAVALLGKNGMGKTTLLKTAMGFLPSWQGRLEFEGRSLTGLTPHEIARLGVGLVPENRRIFPGLTVRENLELGLSAVPRRTAALRRERLDEVFRHFPRLAERLDQAGKTLSGGEQQMLAIGRVMMAGARLILMDEPTQGLAPAFVRGIRDMIAELKRLRRHRAPRGAERASGALGVRPRLHHGEGTDRVRGVVEGAAREPGDAGEARRVGWRIHKRDQFMSDRTREAAGSCPLWMALPMSSLEALFEQPGKGCRNHPEPGRVAPARSGGLKGANTRPLHAEEHPPRQPADSRSRSFTKRRGSR